MTIDFCRLVIAKDKVSAKQRDLLELEHDLQDALIDIQQEHDEMAASIETLEIGLEKSDIRAAEA